MKWFVVRAVRLIVRSIDVGEEGIVSGGDFLIFGYDIHDDVRRGPALPAAPRSG